MFVATYTHTRADLTKKFYYDVSLESKALVQAAAALSAAAAGWLGETSMMSADLLSNVVTVNWTDQASHDAYELANKEFLDSYRGSRIAYEATEGGVTTTTFASV